MTSAPLWTRVSTVELKDRSIDVTKLQIMMQIITGFGKELSTRNGKPSLLVDALKQELGFPCWVGGITQQCTPEAWVEHSLAAVMSFKAEPESNGVPCLYFFACKLQAGEQVITIEVYNADDIDRQPNRRSEIVDRLLMLA